MGFSQHKLTTNYTKILSEYIKNIKYEDLPPEVVERAKIITTQVIGVSLAAKNMGRQGSSCPPPGWMTWPVCSPAPKAS